MYPAPTGAGSWYHPATSTHPTTVDGSHFDMRATHVAVAVWCDHDSGTRSCTPTAAKATVADGELTVTTKRGTWRRAVLYRTGTGKLADTGVLSTFSDIMNASLVHLNEARDTGSVSLMSSCRQDKGEESAHGSLECGADATMHTTCNPHTYHGSVDRGVAHDYGANTHVHGTRAAARCYSTPCDRCDVTRAAYHRVTDRHASPVLQSYAGHPIHPKPQVDHSACTTSASSATIPHRHRGNDSIHVAVEMCALCRDEEGHDGLADVLSVLKQHDAHEIEGYIRTDDTCVSLGCC